MVKRTLIVLGMFGLILMAAGPSMAFLQMFPPAPCFGPDVFTCKPMYLPVDCPEPIQRNIVKTWECKIVGPCPAVMPAGGGCGTGVLGRDDRIGLLTSLATAIASPFDWVFGGMDGVYGCLPANGGDAMCGSSIPGPIPGAAAAFIGLFSPGSTDGSFFGGLW